MKGLQFFGVCSASRFISSRMSSAFQAVHRSDNFTGFGNRPDLTPAHQLVLPRGITVKICDNRKKPISGIVCLLTKCKYSPEQISRAIYLRKTEAENQNRSLYENNKAVYSFLRYGVPVKIEAGKATETVKLINWQNQNKIILLSPKK